MIFLLSIWGCQTRIIEGRIENPYNQPVDTVTIIVNFDENKEQSSPYGLYAIKTKGNEAITLEYLKNGYAPKQVALECPKRRCNAPVVQLEPLDLYVPHQPELLLPVLNTNKME